MASSKEYLNFVLDHQCSSLSARAMMGEYVLSLLLTENSLAG